MSAGWGAKIVRKLTCFITEGDVNLVESEEYWDPHAVAGLLKSYLRELPSSILTRDLHLLFLAVIGAFTYLPGSTIN